MLREKRVLVADPHSMCRDVIVFQLQEWGVDVDECADPEEVAEKLCINSSETTSFDYAVVDHVLLRSSGSGSELGKILDTISDVRVLLMCHMNELEGLPGVLRGHVLLKPVRYSNMLESFEYSLMENGVSGKVGNGTFSSSDKQRLRASKRILVAEDNIINQQVIIGILNKYGFGRIDIAADGYEAIHAMTQQKYDIVLMDVSMPVMDGLDATRVIRSSKKSKQEKDIPIIALTAHALKGDQERFISSGMSDYISKPIEQEVLIQKVETWLFEKVKQPESESRDELNWTAGSDRSDAGQPMLLNTEALSNRLLRDEELVKMVLTEFFKDLPGQISLLRDAVLAEDTEAIGRQAHKIKGAAGNVGAEILMGYMITMEEAVHINDAETMERLLMELDRHQADIEKESQRVFS